MVIFISILWILGDLYISLRTANMTTPLSLYEWWGILIGGCALGVFALIAELLERRSNNTERAGHVREMAALREQLARQDGFNAGAFTSLGRMASRTLELAEDQALSVGNQQLHKQIGELRSELGSLKAAVDGSRPTAVSFLGGALGPASPISIQSPTNGNKVEHRDDVRGFVFGIGVDVQVWVRPGNGMYYLQGTIKSLVEPIWSMKCSFGKLDSPTGSRYEIVAVVGINLPTENKLRDLPSGIVRSQSITVIRK